MNRDAILLKQMDATAEHITITVKASNIVEKEKHNLCMKAQS